MALAAITDPEKPYTRRSFSPRFLEGRAWLRRRFEEAGLAVRLDAGGNLIGRLEGSLADAKPIVIGSHSDTVPSGGRFDGPAGIIAALEVVRALREQGYKPRHPIEVVDFLAEEPSEYGVSCVGSRAMAGALDDAMLEARNAAGETLAAAIARIGGDPGRLDEARRENIAGYLELHIEQGVVLENNGVDLGLVTAIVGIARVEIVFEGAADHAGTTPMALRRDAGLAAARLILDVAAAAREFAAAGLRTLRRHDGNSRTTAQRGQCRAGPVTTWCSISGLKTMVSCRNSSPISMCAAEPRRPPRTSGVPVSNCCRARAPRIATKDCWACCDKAPRATG